MMDDRDGRRLRSGMQADRHIPLQGASNFRDFGGYDVASGGAVARGRLFRSDRLSELTAADYETLGGYRIRFVYDLRRASEVDASPTRWSGAAAPELIHAPIFQDDGHSVFRLGDEDLRPDAAMARTLMMESYRRMVSEAGPLAALGGIFTRLTAPGAFPALFHCAAGKDRTGVTCALILSALGVSREDIVADFMLTQKHYDALGALERNIPQAALTESPGWSREALMPLFGVEPAFIEAALAQVDAGGGIEAFLRDGLGVRRDGLERLRGQLVV
jgi:protein-tyrosine phosphatase